MKEKTYRSIAHFFTAAFNPYFIPTIGFLILLSYNSGLERYSPKLIYILLGIVFVTTCILPALFSSFIHYSSKNKTDNNIRDQRIIPSVFTAFSVFLGAQLLGKLPVPDIFRLFLLGACLLLIILFMITTKWKISTHTASLGALLGALLALTLLYGMDLRWSIVATVLISGIVGSSQIYLQKQNPTQVFSGYGMGVLGMYLTIYFF